MLSILVLLPPSLEELRAFPNAPADLFSMLWQGAYPRIYDRNIPAQQWLADYTHTYLQRDVRQVINVGDLQVFAGFLKLCAGRTAQEINMSAIGSDSGVSHNTVRAWMSVLEAGYLIHRLPAWHLNIRKQVVKARKLHFFDTGLACYLLGIQAPDQLRFHPLRGAVFESWVVSEIYKAIVHSGMQPDLFHYRETRGTEIDLLIDRGRELDAVEIKSGATTTADFFKNLEFFQGRMKDAGKKLRIRSHVVYGGDDTHQRSRAQILSWRDVQKLAKPPSMLGE